MYAFMKHNATSLFRLLIILLTLIIVVPTDAISATKRKSRNTVKRTKLDYENMFLTFDVGGGLYTYRYKVDGKKQNMKPGGTANICYNQFFYRGFGWGAGIGATYYGAATTFTTLETSQIVDENVHSTSYTIGGQPETFQGGEPETYNFNTQFNSLQERQHLIQLEVPVMGMYKLKNMAPQWDLTVALGARLGLPLMKRYKVKSGYYETSGYYASTNVEYHNLPQHGFESVEPKEKGKSNLALLSCNLFMDAGCNYHIDRGRTVYFGLYFSYCVTNLAKKNGSTIVSKNGLSDISYNGVLGSSMVDNAHLMGIGAKVQLCLDFNRVKALFKRKRTGSMYRSARSIF